MCGCDRLKTMNTPTSSLQSPSSYDRRTIAFHWMSAFLVLALWLLGQTIDWFPRGTPRVTARSLHIVVGALLVVVVGLRLVWRFRGGTRLLPAESGWVGRAASGVHHVLYLVLIATLVVGMASAWVRGDNLFGLVHIPAFDPGNKALRHEVVEWHETLANGLLVLAAVHAVAALWHHFIRKDGVLRRMVPSSLPR